jgi:CTP:molybdopterin cytidylyltransferase MocA
MDPAPVYAILLAAGEGRRLGLPKAALQLRKHWMLPILVRSLRKGGASKVHLVLSERALDAIADLGDPGADRELINRAALAGRTGSIQTGWQHVPDDAAVLVHPCDMPLLQAATVQALIRAWHADGSPDLGLVRPISSGRRGGHPLLLGPAWRKEVLASDPDRPLRELLRMAPNGLRDVRCDDPGAFLDVDTPEQLQLLEALLPE